MSNTNEVTPPADMRPAGHDFRLPAVDRALSLFELLADSREGLTLSQLSRSLNIPKSTTHYLIHTLMTRGYVQKDIDGRHYLLGLRFAEVANSCPGEGHLKSQLMPALEHIAARFGLTASATVQRDAEAVIIANVEYSGDRGGVWVGRHLDLHCTAQGKALISMLSDHELNELFGERELARFTERTISSLPSLKAHLAVVRQNGFALNDEEQVIGMRAIAVPVVDAAGSVVASVSVRGSTKRIPNFRIAGLGREMSDMARSLAIASHG